MPKKYKNFLDECLNFYNKTGYRVLEFDKYKEKDHWNHITDCLYFLIDAGYFKKIRKDQRYFIVEFTPKGLVEN